MKNFLFFLFFLFLLSFPFTTAIGISPPKMYIDYEEGATLNIDLIVIDSGTSKNVRLYKEGWLSEFVSLSENEFVFEPDERYHQLSATFTMPPYDTITEYGPQRFYIGAKDIVESSGTVSASVAVKMWVSVDIPFPGKYARIHSLQAENINEGENASTTFIVRNRGTNALSNSRVTLTLKNFAGEVMDVKEYGNVFIGVEKNRTFEDMFTTDEYDSGIYTLTGTFYYDDGKSIEKSTTFFIGSTDVILTEYTSYLEQGKINKVNLTLQSIWGSSLENIRLSITADGKTTNMPALDLGPFEKMTVEGFIEPKVSNATSLDAILHMKIPVGDGVVFEKDTSMEFTLLVPAEKENPLSLNATTFLVAIAITLVLALIANVIFMTRSRSSEKSSKKSSKKK